MMSPRRLVFLLVLLSQVACTVTAWTASEISRLSQKNVCLRMQHDDDDDSTQLQRRHFLQTALATATAAALALPTVASAAASRAVGSGELACREAGNCLEKGEWDGAVGWSWGGKDRCDATDPLCGPDAGCGTDSGVLKLGLYEQCPVATQQLVDFLTVGISAKSSTKSSSLGALSVPVSLAAGGILDSIIPGLTIDFGVPSQANAYARARGMTKAGDSFVPQARPKVDFSEDKIVRSHNAAGLLSVARKGLGYGGTGFESDDETFEQSFLITNDAVPSLDKAGRRVVGQVMDAASMSFLERLASLPTKKGLKGVIPGQTAGPPLLKVTVRDVQVSAVPASKPS